MKKILYSRTPEIETADLSKSHASLNLSQIPADCLLLINSSTAIKNIWINAWHCNNIDKWKKNLTLLKTFIYYCHTFITYLSMMNVSHGNLRIFLINFKY